ncbi:MAG: DUF721 domain-containing protein [Acidimicrobiales bacterium]
MPRDRFGHDCGPQRISGSLEQLAGRLGGSDGRRLTRLFAQWEEIVGPTFADHIRPVSVTPDELVVLVDHPAWATQVRHLGDRLLDRVGEVSGLDRPARLEVRVAR